MSILAQRRGTVNTRGQTATVTLYYKVYFIINVDILHVSVYGTMVTATTPCVTDRLLFVRTRQ